jgi:hypothetical protein
MDAMKASEHASHAASLHLTFDRAILRAGKHILSHQEYSPALPLYLPVLSSRIPLLYRDQPSKIELERRSSNAILKL